MLMFKRKSPKVLASVVVRVWCGRAFCRAVGGPEVRGVSEPPSSLKTKLCGANQCVSDFQHEPYEASANVF